MKVKELDRTVNVAWSPAAQHPIMMAAGTAAQQLDASFSTNAALEIYALNLTEPGLDMELRSVTPSEHRFHKVVWGSYGFGGEHDNGIIVGGCDNGRIQMYSAAKLLAGEDGVIARQDKHTGAVRALDFNPFQANLLATGASDSEIYIWDLKNTAAPMTPGAKSQPGEDVLWISWNRQVQHILASTFSQRCVVWDLRKNEPIIKLSDSTSRIRWKVVAWHPEVATQLCLASEEDQTPVIQVWDLRFATSPLKVLENHQRGVLSIAWCAQDPDLLLSCGKDNRILCWNPNSDMPGGEVVCDIATGNQWNFDVSWCPRNPAIVASSSFDGHVSVYSLMGGQSQVQTSNKIADSFPGMDAYAQAPASQQHQVFVDLKKPPKWLRRPVGASFAFGGKLVTFENDAPSVGVRCVRVSQVVTERDLVARSDQLEAALQSGRYADFCQAKMAAGRTQHDRLVWSCLRANFVPDTRVELLGLLGYREDELNNKLSRVVGKPANARADVDSLTEGIASLRRDDMNGDASSAVFDSIAATTKATPEKKPFKIKTGDDVDGLICQSLLLGNTEAAVELCLQDGRMADAIILAMTGGSDLLAKTQYRYFQQSQGYLSSLISAVVTEDWSQVVRSCEVESWKEALAAALTHTNNDELPLLCDQLGERLEAEGKGDLSLNAQLCYICAGHLNKLVDSWTTAVQPSSPAELQELVELVMVLRKAVEQQGRTVDTSGRLADLLSRYASLLASQGSLDAALTYLGNSEEEQIALLRDRLYRTLGHLPAYPQQQQQQQQPQQQQQQSKSQLHAARGQRQTKPYYQEQAQHDQGYPGQPAAMPAAVPNYGRAFNQAPYAPAQPQQSPALYPASSPAPQGGTNVTTRGKYVVDPSVQKGPSYPGGPVASRFSPGPISNQPASYAPPSQSPYTPQPALYTPAPQPNVYTPAPVSVLPPAGHALNQPQGSPYGAVQSNAYPAANAYAPQDPYNSTDASGAPGTAQPSVHMGGAPPPGWNDPPMVNASRNQPKTDYIAQNPITHPLYGGALPDQPLMGNMGGPPPPGSYNGQQQQVFEHQPLQQQNYPSGGGYGGTAGSMDHSYAAQQHHHQQQQQPPVVAKAAEPPKPKRAIPEEHMYLQTVFDELQTRCTCAANNPQSRRKLEDVSRKLETLYDALRESRLSNNTLQGLHQMVQSRRKLEDVSRKLETLYDALRESRLSNNTLQGLHQMVQLVQIGDYTRGLELHTQLVSGPDFSQIASFMPGLKVLLQSALQLSVYLQ